MDEKNITCIQKVKFIFDFFEKREWGQGEEPPLKSIVKSSGIEPAAVADLSRFLHNRLDRIAKMMEILMSAHDGWATSGKRDKILLETSTYDFNDALKLLKDNGFNDDEFVLKVEYERKWGLL
ncbi:hypothetical protein [Desulfocucumis palustris]|nr:hypothetical protein [Desulfocucumis palustris]